MQGPADGEQKKNLGATKADDAEIPFHLWNDRILSPHSYLTLEQENTALTNIRTFALRWWRRRITKEFLTWFQSEYLIFFQRLEVREILQYKRAWKDWQAGQDCIRCCANSSWWEWDLGSHPLHWRWHQDYQLLIRDGVLPWFLSKPPKYMVPQKGEPDPNLCACIKGKLHKIRAKGYIIPGTVKSLTSFFTIPKGDDDIRVVYNGTQSGLNESIWAPWFPLPTIERHLHAVMPGTFMADLDIEEQFLNFILHPKVQPYAGVDFTAYFPEEVAHHSTRQTYGSIGNTVGWALNHHLTMLVKGLIMRMRCCEATH